MTLAIIEKDVYGVRERFEQVLVDRNLNFDREAGFAVQVLSNSDYAMRIAMQNRQSVINAVTNIAAIGISLNPAKKEAYLVPRDGKICLDISYMGLLSIAIHSGSIKWGQAEIVHLADTFVLNGFDKPPTHTRNPFSKDRGEIVGAYVVAKTADGDYLTTVMSIDEVYAIRDRSSAWKAFMEKKKSCPWVTDEGEMIKKTVIKRAYKTWPKTDRLDTAVHYLNTEAGEGLSEVQKPEKSLLIKPTDGAMESLSIEAQQYMHELAADVKRLFSDSTIDQVYDRIEIEQLDNDQKVALWSLLPSDVRSALKKEGKAREEAQKAVP